MAWASPKGVIWGVLVGHVAPGVFAYMETKEGMAILGWATSGSVKVSDHFSQVLFISRALQRHDLINSSKPPGDGGR